MPKNIANVVNHLDFKHVCGLIDDFGFEGIVEAFCAGEQRAFWKREVALLDTAEVLGSRPRIAEVTSCEVNELVPSFGQLCVELADPNVAVLDPEGLEEVADKIRFCYRPVDVADDQFADRRVRVEENRSFLR